MKKPIVLGFLSALAVTITVSGIGQIQSRFLSPVPDGYSIFESLKPRLENKKLKFRLQHDISLVPVVNAAQPYEKAHAYAVVDLDTGKVITSKDGDKQVPIASITKLMSAIVALDLGSPEDLFTVTERAANIIPTKIGVVPGQKLTINELLHAMLLTSANDAAEVMRDGFDTKYSRDTFVKAMNYKAEFLGLRHTHFANPQGFDDPANYSSAEDLAVLSQYALTNYPLLAQIVKKDYAFLPASKNHKQYDLYNWNGLIGVYPTAQGIKIGNTGDAGTTTVVVAARNGKKMAAVLLGAPGVLERDLWTAELLDIGYKESLGLTAVAVTEDDLRDKYATWKYFNN